MRYIVSPVRARSLEKSDVAQVVEQLNPHVALSPLIV